MRTNATNRRKARRVLYPCPRCKEPDRITPAERARRYQCAECAAKAEAGVEGY